MELFETGAMTGWGTNQFGEPILPRAWQVEAVPTIMNCWESGKHGVMRAVMGAGKSIAQRKILSLALKTLAEKGSEAKMIVSAPKRSLVRQLGATFGNMFTVGYYYSDRKNLKPQVIVTCNASLPRLSEVLVKHEIDVALIMFDEAHRTQNNQCKSMVNAYPETSRIGVTATPFRRDHRETLALFDEILYDYGFADAVRDGVIFPPTVIGYDGEKEDSNLVCAEMISAENGVGLVNAYNIADAEEFADFLTARGTRAFAIHSKNSNMHPVLLNELQAGKTKVLVHVNLMTEGVDLPWLNFLCLRRKNLSGEDEQGKIKRVSLKLDNGDSVTISGGGESLLRFQQEVGRVLRTYPGKTEARVLDPHDHFNTLGMGGFVSIGESEVSNLDEMENVEREIDYEEPEERKGSLLVETQITARSSVSAWMRVLILEAEFHKKIKPVNRGQWRNESPSSSQIWKVNDIWRKASTAVRATIDLRSRQMIWNGIQEMEKGNLNRGDVSDLITILSACIEYKNWIWKTHEGKTS